MPDIKYRISNAQVDLFCSQNNYPTTISNPAVGALPGSMIANPETKIAFVERRIREYFLGQARTGMQKSREPARRAETAADDAAITIAPGVVT